MSKANFNYVSCFRVHGVPLLPPILSDEERRQCRILRQKAMDVEKRLEARRKFRERKRLEVVEEEPSHEFDETDDGNSSSAKEVLEFIRQALGDSNDLEEVKFLISQVTEELKKRKSLGSHDSTSNDADSISFNNTALHNLDLENINFDRESVGASSVNFDDHKSECANLEKQLPASETGVSDKALVKKAESVVYEIEEANTSDSIRNVTDNQLNIDKTEDMLSELSKISLNENTATKNNEDDLMTPTKLVRSNSYTLDSPSPSVLVYLRSLAQESFVEKVEVSDKVVKNLNNCWSEEEPKQILSAKVYQLNNQNNDLESDSSVHEHDDCSIGVENGKKEFYVLKENDVDLLKKVDAALTIQAAARGFLVRRLMKTQKIKDLKVIIKEAVLCAWSLYGERAVSPADIQLHERIIKQVTAACYELHCIFFNWSTSERMALIRSDREKLKNPKPIFRVSRQRKSSESSSVSSSIRSKSASSISGMSRSSTQELQRPTTLPTNLRRNVRYQHWRNTPRVSNSDGVAVSTNSR